MHNICWMVVGVLVVIGGRVGSWKCFCRVAGLMWCGWLMYSLVVFVVAVLVLGVGSVLIWGCKFYSCQRHGVGLLRGVLWLLL